MTGLRFAETMTGRISTRARDGWDGYQRVDAVSAVLRIHIDIPDVAAYLAADRHVATMRADIVIPVLGGHFLTSGGQFVCFAPGVGPEGTEVLQMLYTAGVANTDRTMDMSARKVLVPGGLRPWRDTTRLLVTLIDRTDDGDSRRMRHHAGMVRLTPAGFLRQLITMRPYGHAHWVEGQRAKAAYVLFFVRGLARVYLRRRVSRAAAAHTLST